MFWLIFIPAVLIIWMAFSYFRAAEIIVGELEVGVIFVRRTKNFSRFLSPGTHFINPITEYCSGMISTGTQNASGMLDNLRTVEGIPVSVGYSVSFSVDPFTILPGIEPKMARALPKAASKIVTGKVAHSLRHLIEEKSIVDLYKENAIKELEDEARGIISERSKILGIKPISSSQMKLGPVRMPEQVEDALKMDYERKLQTGTSIDALEKLHAVVSKFEEKDMQRLSELERLRIVENSGSLVFLKDSLIQRLPEIGDMGVNGSREYEN